MAALVPLADAVARRRRSDEVQPIQAGVCRLTGEHLNEITVLQRCRQRAEPIVDASAMAVIAHLGVNAISEINGGCPLAQTEHIALRGKDEHLLVKQVFLDRGEVVVVIVVAAFLLPIHQLTQPVEPLRIAAAAGRRAAFLVFPVGRNPEFGHMVHLKCADLHFDRAMPTDHCGVQGLITVGFRQPDVVLEAAGNRAEGVVNHREGAIAALNVGGEDPQRRHVVDLVELLLLALHLAPDAKQMFGATTHLAVL